MKRVLTLTAMGVFCLAMPKAERASDGSIPIPADRLEDSYKIYSRLIPNGEMSMPQWPHAMWLVEKETVTVVPDDQPCSTSGNMGMNPHTDVHPTPDRQQDFQEILQDFDRHCHDHLQLRQDIWKLDIPVLLLNAKEQKEARDTQFGTRPGPVDGSRYKGASVIFGFSEIYFNANHTVALVYLTDWCGNLCGHGSWLALALENGHWKSLAWHAPFWIS